MRDKKDTDQSIYSLVIDDAQRTSEWNVFIGDKITSIKPFREEDGALWFTVWAGDEITKRINGRFVVEVDYFTRSE